MSWENSVLPVFMATSGQIPGRLPELAITVQIDTTLYSSETSGSHGFQRFNPSFNRIAVIQINLALILKLIGTISPLLRKLGLVALFVLFSLLVSYFSNLDDNKLIRSEDIHKLIGTIRPLPSSTAVSNSKNRKPSYVYESIGYISERSCSDVAAHYLHEFEVKGIVFNHLSERDFWTSADIYNFCAQLHETTYEVALSFQEQRHFSKERGCSYGVGINWPPRLFGICNRNG